VNVIDITNCQLYGSAIDVRRQFRRIQQPVR